MDGDLVAMVWDVPTKVIKTVAKITSDSPEVVETVVKGLLGLILK